MRIFNRRSNNGTVVTEPNALFQSGWGAMTFGAAGTSNNVVITFPQAYTSAPIVVATFGGDQTSGTVAYGSGTNIIKMFVGIKATDVTATNFRCYIFPTDNTQYTTGQIVYFQWIAIGT